MARKKVKPTQPKAPKMKKVVPGKVGRPKKPVGLGAALAGMGGSSPMGMPPPGGPPPMGLPSGAPPMMRRGGKVKRK